MSDEGQILVRPMQNAGQIKVSRGQINARKRLTEVGLPPMKVGLRSNEGRIKVGSMLNASPIRPIEVGLPPVKVG